MKVKKKVLPLGFPQCEENECLDSVFTISIYHLQSISIFYSYPLRPSRTLTSPGRVVPLLQLHYQVTFFLSLHQLQNQSTVRVHGFHLENKEEIQFYTFASASK